MTFHRGDRVVDHALGQEDLTQHDVTKHDGSPVPLVRMTTVLTVRGDVDASVVDALRDTVRPLLRTDHRLVLDMSDVGFLGSAGLRFLLEVHRDCREGNQPWAVVTGRAVRRMLQAVGADPTIPAFDSLAEALCAARVVDGGPPRLMPVTGRDKVQC